MCRIRSESQQKQLLPEKDLLFKHAMEIAVRMEVANKSAKDLKTNAVPLSVS